MLLKLAVGEQIYAVEVPDSLIAEAEDIFKKIDADMDRGWQMSRTWADNPDTLQRCQILADKALTALHKQNRQMVQISAAYILSRLPGVTRVDIATDGDMTQTHFEMSEHRDQTRRGP